MLTVSRRTLGALVSSAALTLVSPPSIPVAAKTTGSPSALNAEEAIARITGDDGVLRFDVAEDGKRFVWSKPRFDDDLPAAGASYISHGYIYPAGTLSDTSDGVNADGSPEVPDKVLGQWSCYGWYIGDGAHTTAGPWVLSTQYYNFGDEWGEASLVSEGYVLAETGGTVHRAITGGTGPFATVRGEMADTSLGFNETEGANARYEVQLQPVPDGKAPLSAAQLNKRPMRGP